MFYANHWPQSIGILSPFWYVSNKIAPFTNIWFDLILEKECKAYRFQLFFKLYFLMKQYKESSS